MKKAFSLIIALTLALALAVPALALEQSEDFYVTDETGSLSQETIDELLTINYGLEQDCGGAQIVVAFVNYFGDLYADEYAVALFNDWSLSSRAMLLCVSPKEKKGGIVVGTQLEGRFTVDDRNEYLEDYFWDDFDDGKYDKAVTRLAGKLADWFYDEYGGERASGGSAQKTGFFAGLLAVVLGILGLVLRNMLLILAIVIVVAAVIWSDKQRWRSYYGYMGMPVPRYHFWYMFTPRPYRRWRGPPRGPGPGPGPGGGRPGGPGGFGGGGGGFRPSGGGRSSGTFGGRSGRPSGGFRPSGGSRPSGGFRPSGGGRSGGSFGGRR